MSQQQNKGTALVTGASSGIGAIYADRLAARGYDLILVARNEERLHDVADRVQRTHGRGVTIVQADLGARDDLARVEAILRTDASITLLVNNAGFGAVTPLLESDVDRMTQMIDINVTAPTRLAYAAAPPFVARGGGTIVNIASTVGIGIEIMNGVYGASKAYVLALTQSLHHELASKGVRAQAVLPGATATDFWDTAGLPHENLPAAMVMRAEDMVDAALAGLDAGEVVTIPPLQDGNDWIEYEATRKALAQRFAHATPGERYLARAAA
ncbi:SDR family NAD(P)-dependent oxidoreductase [Massilia dura]|uniref:NADP-dependent 3-hydroxy acid dehydrogenase YdfG n=1 Tax=Pseudoduganella dura TaxID=321982 RepID=A0A6I3XE47_9BURK|nr:SDR family oxidoreductase [Pseudoduganella dura]MUI15224.1 SDR family NAD(P)-dependent oxidoreductase [Pseudoduganella dura]GGY06827.1 oxidoreductase [Pseudoduganella dura]